MITMKSNIQITNTDAIRYNCNHRMTYILGKWIFLSLNGITGRFGYLDLYRYLPFYNIDNMLDNLYH